MHGEVDTFYRGELRLGLLYTLGEKDSKRGTLTVLVRQAKELPIMDPNGLANAAVKCYLLPDRSASGKRKKGVIKNNLNPVWEEQFVYKNVTLGELSGERVLEVTVWDYDKHGNEFIGGLRLGPTPFHAAKHKDWMDSIGEEISHWESMLAHPGEWVEHWQTLRTTMVPRKLDLSSVPPLQVIPLNPFTRDGYLYITLHVSGLFTMEVVETALAGCSHSIQVGLSMSMLILACNYSRKWLFQNVA